MTITISVIGQGSDNILISYSGFAPPGPPPFDYIYTIYWAPGNGYIDAAAVKTAFLMNSDVITYIGSTGQYTVTGLSPNQTYSFVISDNETNSDVIQGTTSAAPGGGGDPHIETINGVKYNLPNDENCYLLFDNNNPNDRVRITTKCWFLPNNRMYNYWNNYMEDTSFFRYVNVQHNNDNLTIDLENLNIVEYDERNINNHTLKQTTNKTDIRISDKYEDKNILSRHYGDYKRNLYKIKFNGVSRKINVSTSNTNYEIRISCDLNCADERNEICLNGGSFEGCTGAFISESQAVMILSLI